MTPVPTALLQGASNFRDVGGYRNAEGRCVRRGQVFRSDHLAGLTPEDLVRLASLGIGHSLDFRGAAESTATPYAIPGVQRLALTIEPTVIARMQALVAQGIVPTTEETVALMEETYRDFVNHNAITFGRFLKHLLEQPTPQVFHCTAGKDRTGFAAALLLSALGVDRPTIEHEPPKNRLPNLLRRHGHMYPLRNMFVQIKVRESLRLIRIHKYILPRVINHK